MRNPWVGLDGAADPVARARLLRRARECVLGGGAAPTIVRDVVRSSWARCAAAGVDPERHAPPRIEDRAEIAERWRSHPLSRFAPLVERLLCDFAHDARHIVVISDAEGRLLWSAGHRSVLAASESISFVPGSLWNEPAAGTNGVGTALALDHAVQIFSAEHYSRDVYRWTCSGAPVHDPETGVVLGIIDLSSGIRASHPHSLALVTAAAQSVEAALREDLAERRERLHAAYLERVTGRDRTPSALLTRSGHVLACSPSGWLPAGVHVPPGAEDLITPDGAELVLEPLGEDGSIAWLSHGGAREDRLVLRALGRSRAEAWIGGERLPLSPRHGELLVLLALRPEGLSSEELAGELYGDASKRVAARA
ncbi:MAG: GAF domain-containing protein, partial [Solirubrobacteraceae bacterium]